MMFDVLCLTLGLGVGFGTGWLSYRGRQNILRRLTEEERMALEKSHNSLQIELARIAERNRILEDQRQSLHSELAQERQFNISLHAELSRERASRNHLEQKLEHQKSDLSQFQQKLGHEFRNVVQQVLEEKSQTLSDLNKSNLNLLLQPISEKLQDFKQKIEEQHYRETRELIVLHNKLANLESGKWRQSNGAPIPADAVHSTQTAPSVTPHDNGEGLNRANEDSAPTTPEILPPDKNRAQISEDAHSGKPLESDAFQGFSPKQEVEIDNFLKRTLGRAQRRKPGD